MRPVASLQHPPTPLFPGLWTAHAHAQPACPQRWAPNMRCPKIHAGPCSPAISLRYCAVSKCHAPRCISLLRRLNPCLIFRRWQARHLNCNSVSFVLAASITFLMPPAFISSSGPLQVRELKIQLVLPDSRILQVRRYKIPTGSGRIQAGSPIFPFSLA